MTLFIPSCIALSFDGFGSLFVCFFGLFTDFHNIFPRISNFFGLSLTEETQLIIRNEHLMHQIGIVLVLHFNPWVEASVGGL
jgi:hypothetical protein